MKNRISTNKSIQIILLTLLTVAASALTTLAQADAAPKSLHNELNALRLEYEVPAVAVVLVSRDDMIWTSALGVTDRKTGKVATIDTLFRIGSITKAFTSLAMLKLQEQGKLSLADPISKYVSDAPLINPWSRTSPLRIAHFLEHTSGLLDLSRLEFDLSDPTPLTLKQGLFFDEPRRLHWQPGVHSSYSNAGAGYAAYVLEIVSKQRYEDFVDRYLFQPLGMNSASFFLDAEIQRKLASGYDTDGKTIIPYWHMIMRPFGGINATTREMGNFVQMLLNYGRYKGRRVMQESSIVRMERPTTTLAAKAGLAYGYGLGNYQYVHKGFLFHGHGGDGDGYLSYYAYNRDTGLGYFVVINAFKHDALRAIRKKIENYLIAGHTPPQPQNVKVPVSALKNLTGTFQAVTYRFPWMKPGKLTDDQIEVVLDEGKLYTKNSAEKHSLLIPVTPYHFRRIEEPIATIAFIENEGEMYLQSDTGNYRRLRTKAEK